MKKAGISLSDVCFIQIFSFSIKKRPPDNGSQSGIRLCPYVGIIQIRLWVEIHNFLSACIQAPLVMNHIFTSGTDYSTESSLTQRQSSKKTGTPIKEFRPYKA